MILSSNVPQSSVAAAISASIIFMNAGTFLTSPFLQILSDVTGEGVPAYMAYLGALIPATVLLIMAIPFSIKLRKAAKAKETSAAGIAS